MIKISDFYNYKGIPPDKMKTSFLKASNDFQFRSLFKARKRILEHGKFDEKTLNLILKSILDEAAKRKYIIQKLKGKQPLSLEGIVEIFDFPSINTIYEILNLKDKGLINESIESEVILDNDERSSILEQKLEKKYQIKRNANLIQENYFKSILTFDDSGICTRCGLCLSICPIDIIEQTDNYVYVDESECITCGLCYSVCPHSVPYQPLYNYKKSFQSSLNYTENLGYYKKIYSAKTLIDEFNEKKQDGGIISSLLYYLLDEKLVDAVITVKHSRKFWKPKIAIIKNKLYLDKTQGSIYSNAPILSVLNKTKKYKKIAIVALPCKIRALAKAEHLPLNLGMFDNIKYKIGLFCMKTFTYENLMNLIKYKFNLELDDVVKMDIKKGRLFLNLINGEIISISLKECRSYFANFCNYCSDLTAEFADISVGAIGSDSGWSSVITRTKKGELLLHRAIDKGLVKLNPKIDVRKRQLLIEKLAMEKKNNCKPTILKNC
ncbi:MAG: Coenzyme F420 hydrogenase/dehydrogenase, beta subunit C-terminal domain [Candidatus Hodarchaeota archaeon]